MTTINPTIKTIEMNALDIAVQTTCEAMMVLRFREEAEFKKSQGWEPLIRQSQYKIMNRYVDRVVLNSPECKAYSDAQNAVRAELKRVRGSEIAAADAVESSPNADPNCDRCGGSGERIDFFPDSADSGSTYDCECTWIVVD